MVFIPSSILRYSSSSLERLYRFSPTSSDANTAAMVLQKPCVPLGDNRMLQGVAVSGLCIQTAWVGSKVIDELMMMRLLRFDDDVIEEEALIII